MLWKAFVPVSCWIAMQTAPVETLHLADDASAPAPQGHARVEEVLERARRKSTTTTAVPARRRSSLLTSVKSIQPKAVSAMRKTSMHGTQQKTQQKGTRPKVSAHDRRGSCFPGIAFAARNEQQGQPTTAVASCSTSATCADRAPVDRPLQRSTSVLPKEAAAAARRAFELDGGATREALQKSAAAAENVVESIFKPFRRGSILDRVLLNDTERLTRNPTRIGMDVLVIHPWAAPARTCTVAPAGLPLQLSWFGAPRRRMAPPAV